MVSHFYHVLVIVFLLVLNFGDSLPFEALEVLDRRSIPLFGSAFSAGAIITEQQSEILKRGAEGLATSSEGLRKTLKSGKLDDGIIARAGMLTACLVKSSQGRRIAILNAFLQMTAFTELVGGENKQIVSRNTTYNFGEDNVGVSLEGYPVESLQAESIGDTEGRERLVDEERVVDSSYVSDLREVCDMREIPQTRVVAQGEKIANITGAERGSRLGIDSPYARLPNHTAIVKVRYDQYELVLQIIAVALLLLDLFIIDDFEKKELKFYHILGILLLAVATIVTVVMGYLQVLNVLGTQSHAWTSCGSYNFVKSADNSTIQGIYYDVVCEWVVVKSKSTGASYLVLVPSLIGGVLLLGLLGRFFIIKYRAHRRFMMEEERDEEIKAVRERERSRKVTPGSERSSKLSPIGWVRSAFVTSAVSILFCGSMAAEFPPRSVDIVGPNLVANGQVLFVGSAASASPWRCAWESAKGPSNDTTSIAGVDDCFARWTPPTEDEGTALLFGEAKVEFVRCAKPGQQCPFTGTRCRATDPSFACRSSLKVPSPIKFFSERTIKLVDRWCSFGSETRKAFCRVKCIRFLAGQQLRMLTREIKNKLGNERVNVHRISEYVFPGCAGPPSSFAGSPSGKSTRFEHFSVAGDDCVNSRRLERLARRRSRNACRQKVREKRDICKGFRGREGERRCRRYLEQICTDGLYTTAIIKSRFMRSADDWLVSRCHQGGMTKFGRLRNWVANPEAVITSEQDVARERGSNRPIIRPVRQGWVFKQFSFSF